MFNLEKGKLVKIGTSGEEVIGTIIDADGEIVRLASGGKITEVPIGKIETVRPHEEPNAAFMALVVGLLTLVVFGVGVLFAYLLWVE